MSKTPNPVDDASLTEPSISDQFDANPDDFIEADGKVYPTDVYHRTSQAVGRQQWVANEWAKGALPLDSHTETTRLVSGTRNFQGIQYPEGHGKLKHYNTIEAVRTLSQVLISNSQCYARGWAKCNTPSRNAWTGERTLLPLTTISVQTDVPHWKYIETVDTFDGIDSDGFDRLVVYDEDTPLVYRAASDKFDDDPLSVEQIRDFETEAGR